MSGEPEMQDTSGVETSQSLSTTPPTFTSENIAWMEAHPSQPMQESSLTANLNNAREGFAQFTHDPEKSDAYAGPDRGDGMALAEVQNEKNQVIEQAFEIGPEYAVRAEEQLERTQALTLSARVVAKLERLQNDIASREWRKILDSQIRNLGTQLEAGTIDSSMGFNTLEELNILRGASVDYSTYDNGGRVVVTAADGKSNMQIGDRSGREVGRALLETGARVRENLGIKVIEGLKKSLAVRRETTTVLKGMVQGYAPTTGSNGYPSPTPTVATVNAGF